MNIWIVNEFSSVWRNELCYFQIEYNPHTVEALRSLFLEFIAGIQIFRNRSGHWDEKAFCFKG